MKPEEQLEYMITMRQHGEEPFLVVSEEISARLDAAQLFDQLRRIEVPSEFATRLERDIHRHISNTNMIKERTSNAQSPLRIKGKGPEHHFRTRQTWSTALGIAAILLLAFVTLVTDFTQNPPGSSLSQQKYSAYQLSPIAPPDQKVNINHLYGALADLSTAVNSGHNDGDIKQKLSIVIARTKDSSAWATSPEHTREQHDLDQALREEEHTLHRLLLHVDWPIQLAFTRQLGVLGDIVPIITNVAAIPQGNGTVLITLSGSGFAQGSRLVINGRVEGTIIKTTSTQLMASINQSNWFDKAHAIGIEGPDNMANQLIVDENSDDDRLRNDNYNSNKASTPTPTSTDR